MSVNKIKILEEKLKIRAKKEEIKRLEEESGRLDFWRDSVLASKKMQRLAELQKEVEEVEELKRLFQNDEKKEFEKKLKELELKSFLSGRYDSGDAILSLHAGQGGVEAMDWTEMLKRMYIRFFERKNWKWEMVEETAGEEAGVKSVTLVVRGRFAYGFLKGEAGTHRLVRQSPFNADKLRQTSFALVEVLPLMEEREVEIKESDLQWQFFRSSTQGGQNVQKVNTAVRLIHKPTNTIVTCQTQRSQEQNRKIALEILHSKLWELEAKKRKDEKKRLRKGGKKASWGTQIRSYVLHPYHLVKDLRTGCETNDTQRVLDGDLEAFIKAEVYKLFQNKASS